MLNFPKAFSVVSYGEQKLVYQCSSISIDIGAKLTFFGYDRLIRENFTVATDECLLYKATRCLHANGYLQTGDSAFEYYTTLKDWQPAKASVQVFHAHLAALFKFDADRSLLDGLVNHYAPITELAIF